MTALEPLRPEPTVDRVIEEVHVARGFHLGNVIKIATREGAVIVDTTGGVDNARRARDALLQADPGETRYLIYTHCHPDHCGGAGQLVSDRTEAVIAHVLLPRLWDRDMVCLWPWHQRVRSWQTGNPVEAGGGYQGGEGGRAFIEPTVVFDTTLDLDVGGLTLHLEHTEGETRDHLLVWIPELGTLLPGDLYYAAFPNLSSPAIGPRPIEAWIESIERFLELEPEHLVPSHTAPVSGRDRVRHVLTTYKEAIEHVWHASVAALNDGVSVDEAARAIVLPEELRNLPWLNERYGTVAWGVRAVYDSLTGWYDGDPASLDPLPRRERDAELVTLAGADAIVSRARSAYDRGDHQLALELASVVISAVPGHDRANEVTAAACVALAETAVSVNQRGFYISAARVAGARRGPEA